MIEVGKKVVIRDAMDNSLIGKPGIVQEMSGGDSSSGRITCCRLEIDGKKGSWLNAWSLDSIEEVLEVKNTLFNTFSYDESRSTAKKLRYKYFEFNGNIYNVEDTEMKRIFK